MWGRRLGYLASVLGCLILYLYFNQWAAWVFLWWLLVLPVFSLLLSIPAMKTARFSLSCPQRVSVGQQVSVQLQSRCRFPLPAYKCKLRLRHCMTGEVFTCVPAEQLQTHHCGGQQIAVESLRLYDYLGLFCKKIKNVEPCVLIVEPEQLPLPKLPEQSTATGITSPKRGGGFSEEHDLRHYVPGDDLRQIHWKLTAKTGKYVVKQPLEQLHAARVPALVLCGTQQQLDRKLGRLLWLSRELLERAQPHMVAVLSGRGLERFSVTDPESMNAMLRSVLTAPAAEQGAAMPAMEDAPQVLLIGGEVDA